MNRYLIIGALLAALAAWFSGTVHGHRAGVAEQKAADQILFDEINHKISTQKAEADAAWRAAQDRNLALVVERDRLKTQLEKRHARDAAATDALRDRYARLGLRYAAESAGSRCGSDGAAAPGTGTDQPAEPAVVELPGALTADLRQLAFDADRLADDYRKCRAYVMDAR